MTNTEPTSEMLKVVTVRGRKVVLVPVLRECSTIPHPTWYVPVTLPAAPWEVEDA